MKKLSTRMAEMILQLRELNARFTDEGQRSERHRRLMLIERQMSRQPDHMNHTQLPKTEIDEP